MSSKTVGERSLLEPYAIPNIPASMYYISDFLTKEEEQDILEHIPRNKWISLSHRRLQAVPARLTATNTLVATTGLPEWLTAHIAAKFAQLELFTSSPHGRANHCLINEYLPGQGIMPHEDGAAYHDIVATVSLSGTLVLDVTPKASSDSEGGCRDDPERDEGAWRIVQEPGSLLVTTGNAYRNTLHGIAELSEDVDLSESSVANWGLLSDQTKVDFIARGGRNERTTRVSLTFRDVLKVSSLGSKIFGRPRG